MPSTDQVPPHHPDIDWPEMWRQVERTVRGEPVSDAQIGMIVTAIRRGLRLTIRDEVLDIACGNGALSSRLFDACKSLHGVDASARHLAVASRYFQVAGRSSFTLCEAAQFVESHSAPERFTKALCYGAFAYFSDDEAGRLLHGLRSRFTNVRRLYLGNLPDRDRAHCFYPSGTEHVLGLDDHTTRIGAWRTRSEICDMAAAEGWKARIAIMPPTFFAAHYRFDAILTRRAR